MSKRLTNIEKEAIYREVQHKYDLENAVDWASENFGVDLTDEQAEKVVEIFSSNYSSDIGVYTQMVEAIREVIDAA